MNNWRIKNKKTSIFHILNNGTIFIKKRLWAVQQLIEGVLFITLV